MVNVLLPVVLPCEGEEPGEGRSEEPTAFQRELYPLCLGYPLVAKIDVQHVDAVRVFGFGEEFKLEVPFARIGFVGKEMSSITLARTPWTSPSHLAGFYRNIQWSGVTPLDAHLDEASTVLLCYKDGGPYVGLVDEHHPPEPANMG